MASTLKRKLSVFSLDKQISIINEIKKDTLQRGLAKKFNCGKEQLQNMVTNKTIMLKNVKKTATNRQIKEDDNHFKKLIRLF